MAGKIIQVCAILYLLQGVCYGAFSGGDFKNCKNNCLSQFYDFSNTDTSDKLNRQTSVLDQIACTEGITVDDAVTKYLFDDSDYSSSTTVKAPKNCAYLFSDLFSDSDINQDQLNTLVTNCYVNECPLANTGTGSGTTGEYDYLYIFNKCQETCIESTQLEAKQTYTDCTSACSTSNSNVTAPSDYTEDLAAVVSCGHLQFLTMADFNYKSVYDSCYTDVDTAYGQDGSDANWKGFLTCKEDCVIPDYTEFDIIDNTVTSTNSNILVSSLVIMASICISLL